jgi:hypothetical protein
LLINMPPRYAKSTCVSIMWPTWVWTREALPGKPHNPTLEGPGTKWMFASYADELRTKHSLDRRKMLQSDWYRARWPKAAELTGDQNVKTLFTNSSSGQMFATTMTGAGTGLGGNYIVIDDPHKTKEESTSADVKAQVAVYGDTFATRHDDKKQGVTVIVMQRINDLDLSAHVLATAEENYVHLKIEAEATEHQVFSFPRSIRRFTREPGDLLWEAREGTVRDPAAESGHGKVEVCSPVSAGSHPGRWRDLSALVVPPSLPPRSRHRPAVGREAAHGDPELGHRGQEKGIQRFLVVHHLGSGRGRGRAHPDARAHDGPDGIRRGQAEGQRPIREVENGDGGLGRGLE